MGVLVTTSTKLIDTRSGDYPRYISDVKSEYNNSSFPRALDSDLLIPLGYDAVLPSDRPDGDVVTEGKPVKAEDGKWYQGWDVRDFNKEELETIFNDMKSGLCREAEDIFMKESFNGIKATYDTDKEITLSVGPEYINRILIASTLCLNAQDKEVYSILDINDTAHDIDAGELLGVCNEVLTKYHKGELALASYIKEVNSAAKKTNLPKRPETFIG
ncbi:hypothetical protein [Proteus mirabilis]|uniref:hypothetical protein n=1 Tax=Proteus mirabilis TaxID=584 RepID=UPI0034D78069